jgi:hypothetical protein
MEKINYDMDSNNLEQKKLYTKNIINNNENSQYENDHNSQIKNKENKINLNSNILNKNNNNENEIEKLKNENIKLKELLNTKLKIISEYQKIIELSKEKFLLFNESNLNLKNKIELNDTKIKMYPTLIKSNEELNNKLNFYLNKIESLKEEMKHNESLNKNQLSNIDKSYKLKIKEYENEITDLNIFIEKLKLELDNLKNIIDILNTKNTNLEIEFSKIIEEKEKENEN